MDSKILDVMEAILGEELGLPGDLGTLEETVIQHMRTLGMHPFS